MRVAHIHVLPFLIFNYFLIPKRSNFNFLRLEFAPEQLCTEAHTEDGVARSCYWSHCVVTGQLPS